MVNILIPSCSNSEFFADSYYPKTLYEVNGKPMIQLVTNTFRNLEGSHFVYMFLQSECNKFHTDNVVSILTDHLSDVIRLKETTGGALCTCLMADEYINNDDELIISNNDQVIDADFNKILDAFRKSNTDCGVVCFETLHPRWSYVRFEGDDVVEAAEKRPVSNKAIAGIYYFKKGSYFTEAAKNAIRKGSMHDGRYYLTAAVNEMILKNMKVRKYDIENDQYHSLFTPERIRIYEEECRKRNEA